MKGIQKMATSRGGARSLECYRAEGKKPIYIMTANEREDAIKNGTACSRFRPNKYNRECWRRKNTCALVGSQFALSGSLPGLRSLRRWLGAVNLDGFPLVQAEELFRVPFRAYLKIFASVLQAFLEVDGRLPIVKILLRLADVRLPFSRIVCWQRTV